MRKRTLLSQVLAVNTALVTATALIAAVLAPEDASDVASVRRLILIALAVVSAVLLNSLLLKQRLAPLDRLVETMDRVDLASPGQRAQTSPGAPREIERLTADFNRMLTRLEDERVDSGRAVLRAQEEERARIAQDLHDEVNQALTAILLRLQAAMLDVPPGLRSELKEIQTLATRAMEELLTLARTLRPTALDDHGLVPALASQVADFGERTGIKTTFHRHGEAPELSDEEQLVLYRVTQESLSNVVQHSGAI
jgi:two-component system sensor histidine kinase UhpB